MRGERVDHPLVESVRNDSEVAQVESDHLGYGWHVSILHPPPVACKQYIAVPVRLSLKVPCLNFTLCSIVTGGREGGRGEGGRGGWREVYFTTSLSSSFSHPVTHSLTHSLITTHFPYWLLYNITLKIRAFLRIAYR